MKEKKTLERPSALRAWLAQQSPAVREPLELASEEQQHSVTEMITLW